jgi:hypothetical protein
VRGYPWCTDGWGSGIAGFRKHKLVFKSVIRVVRSVTCVNASVKPVREAISSRISGKSTRGSLVANRVAQCQERRRLLQLVERAQDKVVFAIDGFEPHSGIIRQSRCDGAISLV